MRILTVLAAAMLLAASSAQAADLAKIERKIAKEPVYQTKTPRYCLLVFGFDAKAHAWLVQDGNTLYVDRNGNGDMTEQGNHLKIKNHTDSSRSFAPAEIAIRGLKHTVIVMQTKAKRSAIGSDEEWERIKKAGPETWIWVLQINAERSTDDKRALPKNVHYIVNGDGAGTLLFAEKPEDAPIVHVNGPFTLALQDRKQRLVAGEKTMLQIGVGVQGLGAGTFAFALYKQTVPENVFPEAEITFAAKSPGQDAIKRKFTLKQRC